MSHSAAIHPKGASKTSPDAGALNWVDTYLGSSVGQKVLVAVTGLGLATFVVFHMIGNLKMFQGPEAINHYAYFLKHDLGALIWIARAGLLGAFLLHVFVTVRLKLKAAAARPVSYYHHRFAQARAASTTMIWTGLVILAFTLFHLAHFTFGIAHEADNGVNYMDMGYNMQTHKPEPRSGDKPEVVHDVYRMVIVGFRTAWISVLYLIAQVLLFLHLSHGIASSLNTLGLYGRRFTMAARLLAYSVAGLILVGNVAIVVAVWTGFVQ